MRSLHTHISNKYLQLCISTKQINTKLIENSSVLSQISKTDNHTGIYSESSFHVETQTVALKNKERSNWRASRAILFLLRATAIA